MAAFSSGLLISAWGRVRIYHEEAAGYCGESSLLLTMNNPGSHWPLSSSHKGPDRIVMDTPICLSLVGITLFETPTNSIFQPGINGSPMFMAK